MEKVYQMNLWNDSFQLIKSGIKTIEMRLNDEKRKNIKIGDVIEFHNTMTKEIIKTKVINIYQYCSFEELYQHHNQISLGYKEDEIASPKDMEKYYQPSKIKQLGVIGIEIKVL